MGASVKAPAGYTAHALPMRQGDEDVNEEDFTTFGVDWCGDLLCLVRSAGLEVQQPSPADLATESTQ